MFAPSGCLKVSRATGLINYLVGIKCSDYMCKYNRTSGKTDFSKKPEYKEALDD